MARRLPSLSRVLDGVQLVAQGTTLVSSLAPLVTEAMKDRDYEAMVSYAAVIASGRKIGLASARTTELFVQAIASLTLDVQEHRANHPLAIFNEDRP